MTLPALCFSMLVPDEKASIFDLEAQGQWQQAYALANKQADIHPDLKIHAENIKRMLNVFSAAEAYQKAGQVNDAAQLVEELLAELDKDKIGNQYLIISTKRLATELAQAKQSANRQKAQDSAERGYVLLKAGDYAGALKLFDEANALVPGSVSSEMRAQAEKGQTRQAALVEQAKQPTLNERVVESLSKAVTTVFEWLVYFAVLVGVYYAARWFRARYMVRPGTGISLEDQCAAAEQREAKSQELSQEMAQAIVNLVNGSASAPASGVLMDLDATNLPNARDPLGGIAAIASHIEANAEPVRIGPFSFQAKQLFQYLALLFKRPYEYTLSGVLKQTDTHLLLQVTKYRRDGSVVEGGLFEASCAADAPRCRDTVIKDVATQIAATLPGSKVTENWRSLRNYLQAESLLSLETGDDERKQRYERAQALLQSALAHDPANWMARFKLASVLRYLGDNEAARDQFDYVERMLGSQEIWCFHHFGAFLRTNPEFPWIVRYNLIVSMSKIASERSIARALILIDQLIEELEAFADPARAATGQSLPQAKTNDRVIRELTERWRSIMEKFHEQQVTLTPKCRDNLLYLTKGGRAAVLCSEIERLREASFTSPDKAQQLYQSMAEILKRIENDEHWLWKMTPNVKSESWQTFAQAHAAAQNAYGRACYVMNKFDDAMKYLRWAIQIHVPQNFPEPHINLAALYIKQRSRLTPDWAEKAKAHLETSLAMSPYNLKARYLLGKVYSSGNLADYDKALEEFRKAGDSDSLSLYQRGMIQLQHKKDVAEAVNLLRRSAAFATRADFRHKEYLYAVLILAAQSGVDERYLKEQLAHAVHVASHLEKRGVTEKLKEIGALMKVKIARQQAALGKAHPDKQEDV
ncbi:MAG: tetratricopeptide repeat protein [Pseudomonadota bacterium]